MQKRTLKVALLAVVALVLVMGFSGTALAGTWPDMPDTVTAPYGVTDNQVAAISQGFTDGLWRPYQNVTRAQFVKMAVAASHTSLYDPAVATFSDVPKGSHYYKYIEGAVKAGLVLPGTTFGPNVPITRLDAVSIMSRWISMAHGIDLATYYTADEIAGLLAHFGDKASIPAASQALVAFAYDWGITVGDKWGNFAGASNLTRIQGATFLIRAQAKVPPAQWSAEKIEILAGDKAENLIGQTHTVTFKVTDAAGHPAVGVLVDFDTLYANPLYVGNISPQAAVTDSFGQVKVNLISHEPGTEKVSATVATVDGGLATQVVTKYWLALDEVYTVGTDEAQNNVGDPHEWAVRVIVFGPGPRSTAQTDWYNYIDTATFNPSSIKEDDGIDAGDWLDYKDELGLAKDGFVPRTMEGIDVLWSIYDVPDDPKTAVNDAIISVGNITAVDGAAITPAAKTATGHTNAAGLSKIKIESTVIGTTLTQAVATYEGNPYPNQLIVHEAVEPDDWDHWMDWDEQPDGDAAQYKKWIPHTLPPATGPISGAGMANVGEEKTMVITLVDTYGNPIAGRQVEWTMQGVGWFETDNDQTTTDKNTAAGNKDIDVTNAAGKAEVFIKSHNAGEQIVHAKVRDKGTGGAEGAWMNYTAEEQWFDVNVATFDNPATYTEYEVWDPNANMGKGGYVTDWNNEALDSNPVATSHTFDMWVYGLKLEYAPTIDFPDWQTPWIDGDVTGSAYDGYIDAKDAAYFGGILLVNEAQFRANGQPIIPGLELSDTSSWCGDENNNGVIDKKEAGNMCVPVAGRWLTLSLVGGYTEYDWDQDGYKEPFTGQTGIYLPLEGKTVTFARANQTAKDLSNLGAWFDGANTAAVGTFTPAKDVTDAAGMVSVTVTSNLKGPQTIKGTVDWVGNPHNGPQLLSGYAKKSWVAGTVAPAGDITIEIWVDGEKICTSKPGEDELADSSSAMWTWEFDGEISVADFNSAHVEVHVLDAYGNDLPDYQVEYLLDTDEWVYSAGQESLSTFLPWAYLVDLDTDNTVKGIDYDQNGPRPDADEPTPESDPYAYIVGPGETQSFFFNRWLGAQYPSEYGIPGLREWWKKVPLMGLGGYYSDEFAAEYNYDWPWQNPGGPELLFDGFDGMFDFNHEGDVMLATDGAKAWTLDGFYMTEGGVMPNKLTGSNIDIQLADSRPFYLSQIFGWDVHYKNILRVMVYAPDNGVAMGDTPIFSCQVHHVWEIPTPTTIDISPASDVNRLDADNGYSETHTVTATVKDQFGDPMPYVDVLFQGLATEGGSPYADGDTYNDTWLDYPDNPVTTDEDGQAVASFYVPVEWSNWNIRAVVDLDMDDIDDWDLFSDVVTKYWAPRVYMPVSQNGMTIEIPGGYYDNNNKTFKVHLDSYDGPVLATGVYDADMNNIVGLTSPGVDYDDFFWVEFVGTSKTDDTPNWIWDLYQD